MPEAVACCSLATPGVASTWLGPVMGVGTGPAPRQSEFTHQTLCPAPWWGLLTNHMLGRGDRVDCPPRDPEATLSCLPGWGLPPHEPQALVSPVSCTPLASVAETAPGPHEARAISVSRAGIEAQQILQKFPLKDSFSRFSFENKFITTSNRNPVALGLITSRPGLS